MRLMGGFSLKGWAALGALLLYGCSGTETGHPVADGTDTGNPMLETAVQGVLRDSLGKPLPACSLWIRRLSPSPQALAKVLYADSSLSEQFLLTDSTGEFAVVGLPAGSYVMQVRSVHENLGLQYRFELAAGDTLDGLGGLRASPLGLLRADLDSGWLTDTLRIPELGLAWVPDSIRVRLPGIPAGSYTLRSDASLYMEIRVEVSPGSP